MEPFDDRRAQMSPQLAMRVAVLGGIAFALFAVIFFRLWFLQVLSGDQYLAQASGNRVRSVTIQAPRGKMTDRNGTVLVDNRNAVAIVVSPTRLPEEEGARRALFTRLSRVLGRSTRPADCVFGSGRDEVVEQLMPVECEVDQNIAVLPYADVVVDPDAARPVFSYLAERAGEFPGVEIRDGWVRDYPYEEVGAHLFGTVRQISEEQLGDERFRGVRGGSIVGQNGLEYTYDRFLRGTDGAQRIQVDAHGRARDRLPERAPRKGHDLELSIDAGLQRAGQAALETGIASGRANGNPASAGAFAALDLRNGEVLALGSHPSFDPNAFTRPISQRVWDARYGEGAGDPLFNRAIQGGFAIGSTFKVVTAAAALADRRTTEGRTYVDTGTWTSGLQRRRNAGGMRFGAVDLRRALAVSVDTYFYDLGEKLNEDPRTHPRGGALQQWSRRFGFGDRTGIDLPGESSGRVPDPNWRKQIAREELQCRRKERVPACGKSDMREWTLGDNVSLAIGQGDFLASPLQLAVAYAAIANGGTVVRPHIGLTVRNDRQQVVERIAPRPARKIEIPGLETIRAGLLASTSEEGGTSAEVFAGFGKPVHGKTGTAQMAGRPADQSWFVAYVDDPERPIVVAAVIEDGGYGAQAAAPAVRQILSQWFYGRAGRVVAAGSASD